MHLKCINTHNVYFINLYNEIANVKMNIINQIITLASIKAHTCYWDQEDDGQSCLRVVTNEIKKTKST